MVGRSALIGISMVGSLLSACGSSMPPASELTGVHFGATTTLPPNPPPAVDVTAGEIPARNIYTMTLALPDLPGGVYNCPADFGIVYNLTFFSGNATAVTASVDPNGCQGVQISGSHHVRQILDESYWTTLAQQLGVPESTIYPYVPPSSP
jgi:hypothetical protein